MCCVTRRFWRGRIGTRWCTMASSREEESTMEAWSTPFTSSSSSSSETVSSPPFTNHLLPRLLSPYLIVTYRFYRHSPQRLLGHRRRQLGKRTRTHCRTGARSWRTRGLKHSNCTTYMLGFRQGAWWYLLCFCFTVEAPRADGAGEARTSGESRRSSASRHNLSRRNGPQQCRHLHLVSPSSHVNMRHHHIWRHARSFQAATSIEGGRCDRKRVEWRRWPDKEQQRKRWEEQTVEERWEKRWEERWEEGGERREWSVRVRFAVTSASENFAILLYSLL